jgi:hypothetical protein
MIIFHENKLLEWFLRVFLTTVFVFTLVFQAFGTHAVFAQSSRMVQEIKTILEAGENHIYRTIPLQAGDTLYINLSGKSGNLDPLLAVASGDNDIETMREIYERQLQNAIDEGYDPLVALEDFANELFIVWDDDSGEGYDAEIAFEVPADGEYLLVVTDAPGTNSFGEYQLSLGLNEPKVLTEEVEETGDVIAVPQKEASQFGVAVQRATGSLANDKQSTFFNLTTFLPGDTLYAYVEGISGNLVPILVLVDFGGKPLRTANLSGLERNGSLLYTFDEISSNYKLQVVSYGEGNQTTTGDFRLIVGLNDPDVLDGEVTDKGDFNIIREPIDVKAGLKIDQITDIDQKAENFTAVADLRLEWQDPRLAFSPDTCQCEFKVYNERVFDEFIDEAESNWPDFVITNQQGNRWTQNKSAVIFPDGKAAYLERFTTTFQAPDFNFKQFPFDTQQFYVRVRSLFPEEFYLYSNDEDYTGMGDQLGEEAWIFTDTETNITTVENNPQFNFRFEAVRQLTYYITRIFVPLILIIIVAWITFFLKDYGKRIDVTVGNLLLFIAYNFTIANDLPRLGYLTFFDKVLISTFIISVLVVIYNVFLKRLEVNGKGELANNIDNYMDWIYPIVYILAFAFLWVSSFN